MVSMDIYGGFHSHGGTPNGWFIMEQPIKMDDNWGTPISGHLHIGNILEIYWKYTEIYGHLLGKLLLNTTAKNQRFFGCLPSFWEGLHLHPVGRCHTASTADAWGPNRNSFCQWKRWCLHQFFPRFLIISHIFHYFPTFSIPFGFCPSPFPRTNCSTLAPKHVVVLPSSASSVLGLIPSQDGSCWWQPRFPGGAQHLPLFFWALSGESGGRKIVVRSKALTHVAHDPVLSRSPSGSGESSWQVADWISSSMVPEMASWAPQVLVSWTMYLGDSTVQDMIPTGKTTFRSHLMQGCMSVFKRGIPNFAAVIASRELFFDQTETY